MSTILLIIYLLILTFQIIIFVKWIKHKNKILWIKLFLFEIFSIALSFALMNYYESLPGTGFMPGFTYLGEFLASFGAMIAYIALLGLTVLSGLIRFLLKKRSR